MHEYSVVENVVSQICDQMRRQKVDHVSAVRLRRGSVFAEAPLLQAWEMLTPGTPLAGSALIVDEFDTTVTCSRCGQNRRVVADDLIGHLFICPDCGRAHHIDEAHGLELVELRP